MKRMWLTCGLAAAWIIAACNAPAWAVREFEIEFKKTYVKADSKDPKEHSFAAAMDKISVETELEEGVVKQACNVCHIKGKAKKMRNEYGEKLASLLDKKADKDHPEKIKAAFSKVAGMKSTKGPTYGELIKGGKLPGE
jgi:hypothetical protein